MIVSVVVPTHNRGRKLQCTVDRLLGCHANAFEEVQVIVVDDGSADPSASLVEPCVVRPPFSLCCIRQSNSGPAAARNTGFRAAKGSVVIFVDDDILVPPELMESHVACHVGKPRRVVFGRSVFRNDGPESPLLSFVGSLDSDLGETAQSEFIRTDIVASGHISVQRAMFDQREGVYRDTLRTPGAEEFELSFRLRQSGIPIIMATRILAIHDQLVNIHSICCQQYKYGIGCAEVAAKVPEATALSQLKHILDVNGHGVAADAMLGRLKRLAKRLLSGEGARRAAVDITELAERLAPGGGAPWSMYRAVMGVHFFAGVREGMRRYGRPQEG